MAAPSDHDILLALGEDLPVGLWVARAPSSELIYANRAFFELMGTDARDARDVPASGFAAHSGLCTRDGAPYPEHRLPMARALAERCPVVVDDIAVRRRDGSRIDLRAVARPVGDPITHVVVTLFDISREVEAERARAACEQQLRRAQRFEAIGTLACGIAHDFNNLMFSVKLLATEAAITEPDPRRRAALESIDDLTERAATLTRALLGFARRNRQRAMPVSLNDIVASMAELLDRALADVELVFDLDASDRGTVVGDPSQLEQLIMDLVLRARDAVNGGAGRIVVRTRDHGAPSGPDADRFVVLEVKDDGLAIPPELRARLFDPPPAGDPEPRRSLAAVRAIVDGHFGTIEVDTGLDGRGTTISVLIPAVGRPWTGRPRAPAIELPRGSGLVLVVDDDHMVRKVVVGALGALGYDTLEATSGGEAIEIYTAQHAEIRAVVLDMVMPGMAGKATYLALRAIDSNVAVLLMSGHTLNEQVQEILDLGVRSFVSKPYSIAALANAMAELIQ